MKVLVLGGLGYVGESLRGLLVDRPDTVEHVHVIDAGWFTAQRLPSTARETVTIKDIRSLKTQDFMSVDAVVNLAAVSNDAMGNAFDSATSQINLDAAKSVAISAKSAGVRTYVFASSASVYGSAGCGVNSEHHPTAPLTAYARSKLAAEEAISHLADDSFQVIALRFATACGVSDNMRTDLVLNDFVATAAKSGGVILKSNGLASRPLINVEDMAHAIFLVLQREKDFSGYFEVFNVGFQDWNFQVLDLAERVSETLAVPIEFHSKASSDSRSYALDFSKWEDFSNGQKPAKTPEQTITNLYEHFESVIASGLDPHKGKFVRLKHLMHLRRSGLLNEDLRESK